MKVKIYTMVLGGDDWCAAHLFATIQERFNYLFDALVSECWGHLSGYPQIGCPVFEDEDGETIDLGEDLNDKEKQAAIDYYYLKATGEICDFSTDTVESPEVISE